MPNFAFRKNAAPRKDFDLNADKNVINPDKPDPGFFSDNKDRFTRDRNEIPRVGNYDQEI